MPLFRGKVGGGGITSTWLRQPWLGHWCLACVYLQLILCNIVKQYRSDDDGNFDHHHCEIYLHVPRKPDIATKAEELNLIRCLQF